MPGQTEDFAPRDYNESSDVELPFEEEREKRPPLDPELKELVEEKRAANKDKPETVIEFDGRRLS